MYLPVFTMKQYCYILAMPENKQNIMCIPYLPSTAVNMYEL